MVRRISLVLAGSLVLGCVSWSVAGAEPAPPAGGDEAGGPLAVYTGVVDAAGLEAIVALGVDRHELEIAALPDAEGQLQVEVIISGDEAAALAADGVELATDAGLAQQRTAAAQAFDVFRPYSGEGGLQEELAIQAATYPRISELVTIGQTIQGKDIDAVRVTANPRRVREGRRPTTVFIGAQHAREWITPEMVRRLLDHVLTSYGTDGRITNLVNTTEMWFIPVANPDGYDYTHADPDNRLWRKNLRDNNGDGQITGADGVDLNRNWPTRWGYDNEGSSPNPSSQTYRGTAAASEPETQAMDALIARITPEFFVNYHSAAELLLYGIGWQVATPSPDDVIYEAMAGDDANPAIPGYDPDIAAELYTTNGDTDTHLQEAYGTLGFTPEMTTCEVASDIDPDDEFVAEDCESGFNFPDNEALVQQEFEKNVPFALATAESAKDPDDPVSVVGRDTPDFVVDSFEVSYGDPQAVAVTAKRAVIGPFLNYRINGGRARLGLATEWQGGERYGFENDDYYAEYRGTVRGTEAGDEVEVWFSGITIDLFPLRIRFVESERFTYTVASDSGSSALIVANEDYTGYNPEEAPSGAPKYIDEHVAALEANGIQSDVWDVDAQGVPHDLGVLSHFPVVLWYLGDNRLTQDAEDVITEFPYYGPNVNLPDSSVAERQQYLTIAVRDHLNAGGKLIHAGETTGYDGLFDELVGDAIGGIYYGLDGAPEQQCVVTLDPLSDCLLLADDFVQYYLGAWDRTALEEPTAVVGTAGPLAGATAEFGGPATIDNPLDEAGGFALTSDLLPPDQFPQFAGQAVAEYLGATGTFAAIEGEFGVAANHFDDAYMRLGRTFDLTGVTAEQGPTFEAQVAFSIEEGYDHLIVETRPVGTDDWTTLPDLNGGTTPDVPAECEAGFFIDLHPALLRYLTLADPCLPTGTSGEWNSITGESNGWNPVRYDLSAYAGQQVELVISYVTDPSTGGTGAFVDDTRLVVDGAVVEANGFEAGLGAWTVLGPPEGTFDNVLDWVVARQLGQVNAAVLTEDTLLLGFGLEQLETDEARAALAAAAIAALTG